MIRTANITLMLIFATCAGLNRPAVAAQDTELAVREAVRRQAFTIELRQKLEEAQRAEQRKDFATAAKLYEACFDLAQKIGPGVEAETQNIVAGLVSVRLELAKQARSRKALQEADAQIRAALRADPKNKAALQFKSENDRLIAEQAGTIPSAEVVDKLPEVRSNKVNAATCVQDGKLLWEMGRLEEAEKKLREALKLDPENPAAAYYLSLVQETRFARASRAHILDSKDSMVEVEQAWAKPVKRDLLPVPNPMVHTNLVYTGKGRQEIISKLNRIRINEVKYDGVELSEVLNNLAKEAQRRDPDKEGINFLILAETAAPAAAATPTINPVTGQPEPAPVVAEPVDLSTVRIKINPPLYNLRLADVLDAIVKTADRPIKYSVEDYAVLFSAKTAEPVPLYIRTFKVDPNTFIQGLESVGALPFGGLQTSQGGGFGGGFGGGGFGGGQFGGQGGALSLPYVNVSPGGFSGGGGQFGGGGGGQGGGLSFVSRTNTMAAVQEAVRQFFTANGVDFSPTSGKSLFFNDRQGLLVVRATLQDLDIIEAAIQVLNAAPPLINIKSKFVEITQTDAKALGFDWYLGNFLMRNGSLGMQGGTAPTYQGAETAANPLGTFPGSYFPGDGLLPPADTRLPIANTDQRLTSGLRNEYGKQTPIPTLATFTGILTDPQFRLVLRALEQRQAADILAENEVTTVSGRQTHIEAVDVQTIVTGNNLNAGVSGGFGGVGGVTGGGGVGVTTGGGNAGATLTSGFNTQMLPFGPTLDVVPYVASDGYSVHMSIIPTYTEFVGYDDATAAKFVPQGSVVSGGGTAASITSTLPLPLMRMRQVTTSVVVWDGQTVVLGGLIAEDNRRLKDKVPVLGDLPIFGRLFRSESTATVKKRLYIFVTPTIIDPAGNRVHTDEDLPFAKTSIPKQPVANPAAMVTN